MLKTLGKPTSKTPDNGKTDFGVYMQYNDIMVQF